MMPYSKTPNRENHMYTTIPPELEQPLTEADKYLEEQHYQEQYENLFYNEINTDFTTIEELELKETIKHEPKMEEIIC